jgi:ABC-type transport system involved in cytochrome bd biosynthesis fused ATPase/permease subunit
MNITLGLALLTYGASVGSLAFALIALMLTLDSRYINHRTAFYNACINTAEYYTPYEEPVQGVKYSIPSKRSKRYLDANTFAQLRWDEARTAQSKAARLLKSNPQAEVGLLMRDALNAINRAEASL